MPEFTSSENRNRRSAAGKISQGFFIVLAILTALYAGRQYCVVKEFKNPIGFALAGNSIFVLEKKNNSLLRFGFSTTRDRLVLKNSAQIEPDDAEYYYMVRGLYASNRGFVVRSFIYNLATKAFVGYRFREYGPDGTSPRDILKIFLKDPASYPEINYAQDSKGNHYFVNNCIGQKNIWKIAGGERAVMSKGNLPAAMQAMGDENDALSNWSAIHVGPEGMIYISSSVIGRVLEYSAKGRRIREIGTVGFKEGDVLAPDELFFLSLEEEAPLLTVASTGNRTWVQFDRQGKAVRTVSPLKSGYPFFDILVGQIYRQKSPPALYSFDLVNKCLIVLGKKLTTVSSYEAKQPLKTGLLSVLALAFLFVVPLSRRIAPHLPQLLFPFYMKFLIFFIPLIIASTYMVGYSVKNIMKSDLTAESVRRSANLSQAVINSLSVADLEKIQKPEDRNAPAYDRIYSTVSRLLDSQKVEHTPKWIIHKIKDGRFYFGISVWKGAIYEPFIVPRDRRVCFRVLEEKTPQYGRFVDEQGEWFSYFTPILDSTGKVIYVLELYRPTEGMDRADKEAEKRILRASAIILLTAVLLLVILFSYVFTRPLQKFIQGTRIVRTGNFDHRIDIHSRDELGALGNAFNEMIVDLKKYTADLKETTAAKERIESELKVARDIQMGILPKTFPPFPDRHEFDIFATLEPAREVGGDLYDLFFTDEEHLCFTVGDVSDKGVPAALFMAVTRTLIRSKATSDFPPEIVLRRVNEDLSRDNPSLMFVTLFLGVLNTRTGELVYCNGGHNPPLIIRADGEVQILEMTGGLALGVKEDFIFKSKTISLSRGDSIFVFTDGVTEAFNKRMEMFSDRRLMAILAALKDRPVDDLIKNVMDEILSFTEGMPQSDDITMMCLKYNGSDQANILIRKDNHS